MPVNSTYKVTLYEVNAMPAQSTKAFTTFGVECAVADDVRRVVRSRVLQLYPAYRLRSVNFLAGQSNALVAYVERV
jgi:hypothetical protein